MKIGTIELQTTSEEIDDLLCSALDMSKADTDRFSALFSDCQSFEDYLAGNEMARAFGLSIATQLGAAMAVGICIGAELYRRRLEEDNAKMLQGFEGMTEADFQP
jgi:hypothetical protein